MLLRILNEVPVPHDDAQGLSLLRAREDCVLDLISRCDAKLVVTLSN